LISFLSPVSGPQGAGLISSGYLTISARTLFLIFHMTAVTFFLLWGREAHLLRGLLRSTSFALRLVSNATPPTHSTSQKQQTSNNKAVLPLLVRRALHRTTRAFSTWKPPQQPQQQAGAKKKLPAFLSDPATYPLIGVVGSVRAFQWVDGFV